MAPARLHNTHWAELCAQSSKVVCGLMVKDLVLHLGLGLGMGNRYFHSLFFCLKSDKHLCLAFLAKTRRGLMSVDTAMLLVAMCDVM